MAPLYFKGFSNWDYQWMEGQAANPDTSNRYVLIYNLIDSNGGLAGDAGKWGFYRYTVNSGNTLTTAAYAANDPNAAAGAGGPSGGRLGGTANGGGADTRHTIVGNVNWNATVNTMAPSLGFADRGDQQLRPWPSPTRR